MHQIPRHIPKIRLIRRDGVIWEYKNLTVAADYLSIVFRYVVSEQIGDQWVKERNWDFRIDTPNYFYYTYILQDEFGEPVTVDELMDARSDKVKYSYYSRWRHRHEPHVFRDGPVPNIHRRSTGNHYRHMKTTQEIREADALLHDDDAEYYGIRARAKRNRSNLPDVWDEQWRRYGEQNWKRYRKTQWKKKR